MRKLIESQKQNKGESGLNFKNKRLTNRSNLNEESNNRVTSDTEVEMAPVDIVSSNEDQEGNFPSEQQLKFITDNHNQQKKKKAYANAFVNIPDNPFISSTTHELSKSKLDNKTVLTSEELRGILDILISDEPKVLNTSPPIFFKQHVHF